MHYNEYYESYSVIIINHNIRMVDSNGISWFRIHNNLTVATTIGYKQRFKYDS